MDDTNPMRDRKARDDLRRRVMSDLSRGVEKTASPHGLMIGLLDLADESERCHERALCAVEAAYALGWADAQRVCASIAELEHAAEQATAQRAPVATVSGDPTSPAVRTVVDAGGLLFRQLAEERALTAARILEEITRLDPMRTTPDLDGLLAEPAPLDSVPVGHCNRCRYCGFTLAAKGGDGCWPSNCSMRPIPAARSYCAGCGAPYARETP